MALLRFESWPVGVVVLVFTIVVSLLVLEVIDDLDDPFGGAWEISAGPLKRIHFGKRPIERIDREAIERAIR
jgi:hypothetical protein